jgi:hypothetical protein
MIEELEPGYYTVETIQELLALSKNYFAVKKIETLYKLRNWNEKYHPEFLKEGQIYFARPNELNDPFDIHRPVQFDISVINEQWFFEELTKIALHNGSHSLSDANTRASNQLDIIRKDPRGYFLRNYEEMINSKWFNDQLGILSFSTSPMDDQLWGYYGGGLKGYAVGFDPIELTRQLNLPGFLVEYTDTIATTGLIGGTLKQQADLYNQKNTKWSFESELRYSTVIESEEERIKYYTPMAVREIILGPRISAENEKEILEVVKEKYSHAQIFKLQVDYLNGVMRPLKI